jgi:hypothetical protein
VPLQKGGEHDVFHTHNYLLGLSNGLYFEAIATNPNAPSPTRARWFDLDRFEGTPRLTNWICASDDIDESLAALDLDLGATVANGTQVSIPQRSLMSAVFTCLG